MNKILLCAPPPEATGGIARWTKHILNHYDSLETKNINLIYFPLGRKKYIPITSPKFIRIFYGIIEYSQTFFLFRKTIKKVRPDIIHITTSASLGLVKDIFLFWLGMKYTKKYIFHFHFGRIPELYKKKNWEWYLITYIIKISYISIVLDSKSYDILLNANIKNIVLIPNPLSNNTLSLIKKNNGIKKDDRKILFVGHLIPTKGIFELISACIDIPNISLEIIGKGNNNIKNKLLDISSKKGNNEWIKILDEQSEEIIIQKMLSSSLFVLPTYSEGFPNVILESMACGCTIIASGVGAIPEMLNVNSDNPGGVCVIPKDFKKLKEIIIYMLENKSLANSCARNSTNLVVNKYIISKVWEQLDSIWKF